MTCPSYATRKKTHDKLDFKTFFLDELQFGVTAVSSKCRSFLTQKFWKKFQNTGVQHEESFSMVIFILSQ